MDSVKEFLNYLYYRGSIAGSLSELRKIEKLIRTIEYSENLPKIEDSLFSVEKFFKEMDYKKHNSG